MSNKDGVSRVEVSVICITYNQGKYIRRALDSMLSQVTDFRFEILLHDDVSTDGTVEVIHEYEEKYPEIIRVIYETENQYSKGVDFFAPMVKEIARGKYIAVCEGDDFWIDDHKLQVQYEAMEVHPECDMCACWGSTVTEDGSRVVSEIRPIYGDGILPAEKVILGGGQYLVTAGLFFRRNMYDKMLPFEKVIALDYAQQIKGSLRGGIWYIDRKMAVYRRYSQGSWTNDVLGDKERLKVQWEKERELLRVLDADTEYRYHNTICERLKSYTPFSEQLEEHRDEISALLSEMKGETYIWGLGRRGKNLEEYLRDLNADISGVCDAVNQNIGGTSRCGNRIVSTEYVLEHADVIIASTRFVYDDLMRSDFGGKILDFQKYMPYG